VEDAAVRGVPASGAASFLGERIEAYVVCPDGDVSEQALRRHCFDRRPSFKVPHRVVFMDKLPRNPSGKLVKSELG
jgi:acyl-CoA synthetase (AMP-forming)/AMP-acid ligase II